MISSLSGELVFPRSPVSHQRRETKLGSVGRWNFHMLFLISFRKPFLTYHSCVFFSFLVFFIEEKKKQIQAHLTDPVALQAVYDSEVCVDEYANPRSAYKLLRYIPSAQSFLQCRQVKNLAEALANPANKSPDAHDIRGMAGINLKKLLPPRPEAETSEPILPLKRKRKGVAKGEASQAVTFATPATALAASKKPEARPVLPGVDTLPSTVDEDVEVVGPFIPGHDPNMAEVLAPFWAPPLESQGERVKENATVLRTGGSESNTASALCEVARLPGDMEVWRKSTNQEVVNNLRRGLMMVSISFFFILSSYTFN